MRKLQIVAEGDVSHAKASLRSLSVEKAKQLADEKRQAAESAALARETARKQIAEAKASGTAQRDELKKLAAAEREAARVAKQAAKEAADAKRVSTDRTRQATRMQETENRRLDENAKQQLIADIRDKAAQRRKMMPDVTPDGGGRSSGGRSRTRMQQAKEFLGAHGGQFLGAAGVAAELMVIQRSIIGFLQAVRKAKNIVLDEKIVAGMAQNKLVEKMQDMRMSKQAIQKVASATSGLDGVKSTEELSQYAMEQLDEGARDPDVLIKKLVKFSRGTTEFTSTQGVANQVARIKRREEIKRLASENDLILDRSAEAALETHGASGKATWGAEFVSGYVEALSGGSQRAKARAVNFVNEDLIFGLRATEATRSNAHVEVSLPEAQVRRLEGPRRTGIE